MDDSWKTVVTLISPFIGGLLGVFLAPLIEKRKSEQQIDDLINMYREELSEIKNKSSAAAHQLHQSHSDLQRYLRNEISPVMFYGFTKIECYFLDDTIKKCYLRFSSDERRAIKALKFIINEFNTINSILISQILDPPQNLKFKKSFDYAVDIFWLCSKLTNDTVFIYTKDHSNEVEHQKALDALGLSSI